MLRRAVVTGDLVEIQRHPWLDLMARPNGFLSGKVARQMTVASYDLIGQTGWVLDRTGPNDTPVRAWPVPGTWIQRRPTESELTWGVNVGGVQWSIPVTDFLLFLDPDPANPYGSGAGLGLTLADELDIDENAAKTVAGWFQNQALPNAIVSLKGARPEVLKRAKADWNNVLQGFKRAYKTHFVNVDVDVKRMDTSFKDQNLVEIRKSVRDMLQQVWNVPPEKLGIVTSSNRATSEAARAIDAEDVQIPRLEMLREQFQRLAEMFDDRLVVDYESPVPADLETKRAVYQALPGRFRIDEERALAGEPPLADGSGEGFLVNGVWVASLRDLTPDIRADHMMAGIPTTNEVRHKLRLPPREGGDAPTMTTTPTMEPETTIGADGVASLTFKPRALLPRAALTAVEVQALTKAVTTASLYEALAPVVRRLIDEWGQEATAVVADATGKSLDAFDGDSDRVRAHMRNLGQERIQRLINSTTKRELTEALEQTIRSGGTDEDLRAAVRGVFERARVERSSIIAETEAAVHSSYAAVEAFRQTGIPMQKEWIATRDGRTRDAHLALDGQRQELDAPFVVEGGQYSGAKAMQPGGFHVAPLDLNCFLPGTKVSGSFHAGFSAKYVGPAVEIQTADGRCLRVTANHEVLTTHGLVRAGLLREDDDLVCDSLGVERWRNGNTESNNIDDMPTSIEEVLRALTRRWPAVRCRVARPDFDGDGEFIESDVDVVTSNGALRDRLQATRCHGDHESDLSSADARVGRLARFRPSSKLVIGDDAVGSGGPSASTLSLDETSVLLESTPLDRLRFGPITYLNADVTKGPAQGIAADAHFVSKLLHGCSGAVATSKVVKIRKFEFSGHVYDVSSDNGLLVADGIIVSNCRCAVGTVILDAQLAATLATRAPTGIAMLGLESTEEQRAAAWARADESLRPWDSRLRRAARDGFDAQEVAVLAALEDALG